MSAIDWPNELDSRSRNKVLEQVKSALTIWRENRGKTFGEDSIVLKEENVDGIDLETGQLVKAGTMRSVISVSTMAMMFAEPIIEHRTSADDLTQHIKNKSYGLEEYVDTLARFFSYINGR